MESGLFFPLTHEETARVRQAVSEAGQPDTPEGRRAWLLSLAARPTTTKNRLLELAQTPEGKAVLGLAKTLLSRGA